MKTTEEFKKSGFMRLVYCEPCASSELQLKGVGSHMDDLEIWIL